MLPANLLLQTADGKPRYMNYESLAEGGFETGTMMGSVDSSYWTKIKTSFTILILFQGSIDTKAVDNVHHVVKELIG